MNNRTIDEPAEYVIGKPISDVIDQMKSDQANDYQSGGDHYCKGRKFQTWNVIEDWVPENMDPYEVYLWGNILKYLSRLGRKDSIDTDLAKAFHYFEKLQEVRNRPTK